MRLTIVYLPGGEVRTLGAGIGASLTRDEEYRALRIVTISADGSIDLAKNRLGRCGNILGPVVDESKKVEP